MNQQDYIGFLTDVLFTNTVSPSCLLDEKGSIVLANEAFMRIVCGDAASAMPGQGPDGEEDGIEEVIGTPFESHLGTGTHAKPFQRFLKKLAVGESGYFDSRSLNAEVPCFRWMVRTQLFDNRPHTMVQGVVMEDGNSVFCKHTKSPYALVHKGAIVDVNAAFCRLLGYDSRQDCQGLTLDSLASDGSKAKLSDIRDWKNGELDITLAHQSGNLFPVRAYFRTTQYQDDRIQVVVFEKKENWSDQMIEDDRIFRETFNQSGLAIAIMGTNGYIYELNEAMAELVGYDKAELIQTVAGELIYKPDREGLKNLGKRMLSGKRTTGSKDIRIKRKNKRLIWTRLTANLITLSKSQKYFLLGFENIDRHKRNERQLTQRAEELERTNAELEHFAYVASHDLKEPLRTISTFLQLIKKRYYDKLDSDANDYIDYTIESTSRLNNLIKNLLEYSSTREFPDDKEMVDLNELLYHVNGNLKEISEARHANLLSEHLPVVNVNRVQMAQLFQNLIDNAIKFSPEGSTPEVIISVDEMAHQYNFSVRDKGIGIQPEDNGKIFGIFNRLHDRSVYKGAGIGLAVCKRIVENHGGKIWAEPAENSGTKFCFTLKKEAPAA